MTTVTFDDHLHSVVTGLAVRMPLPQGLTPAIRPLSQGSETLLQGIPRLLLGLVKQIGSSEGCQ